MLILAARGGTIIVGRGAGFILPPESTIHVLVTAPMDQRIACMSQRLRLSEPEAESEVRARDRRRSEFLATLSDSTLDDIEAFDLVLNSARLGVELCAGLIAKAARRPSAENSGNENS